MLPGARRQAGRAGDANSNQVTVPASSCAKLHRADSIWTSWRPRPFSARAAGPAWLDDSMGAVAPRSAVLDRVGHQFAGQQDREICLGALGAEGPADKGARVGHALGLARN